MARLTPAQAREKHARNLKASIEDIQIGVNRVSEAPGVKAAAAQQKMLQNLTAAVNSGKWANNVKAVSLEEWRRKMTEKGIPRIAAGIDGAADRMEAFFSKLFAYQDTLSAEIARMPDLTLEDSIARMTKFVRGMAKFSNG